ncbi:hypothetical protein [Paeniglutamicibacter kerguelensis]|uniref:Uncharacterized protein n=1 Tax=Paeniglutamicibacter kerguelensis TaxID=254788 RepID=A0ABS4XIC9_9MICC|nr:hypothetical protein [Paeniglutamicibacter kerguelensis]MBP2388228.1 hypothetical protein [Paeniglutamicibacter kerguelensis]
MSTPIASINSPAVRSAEFIFTGPEVLHARTAKAVEQVAFRTSKKVEGRETP